MSDVFILDERTAGGYMSVDFSMPESPVGLEALRADVRSFLSEQRAAAAFVPSSNSWTDVNPAFSAACGERGYIGMTWPPEYGGGGRSQLAQFVVVEEMLAAGAPVGGHWLADRQSGPQILKFGTEYAKRAILPRIMAGKACFAIGMSEPDSGSDLASIRTRAERCSGGWRIHGRKVWTTNAHNAQYLTVLCRTDPESRRHAGLSQLIVALPDPQVSIRPIMNMMGKREFNEVLLDGCFVPDDMVLGQPGDGWSIVIEELALERSGPDRYMSAFPLYAELLEALASASHQGVSLEKHSVRELGRLLAQTANLRQMSRSVAGMIQGGTKPNVQAALVKEMGSLLEQDIPETVRQLMLAESSIRFDSSLESHLHRTMLEAPSFSLRGGTREILRGIIARSIAS